MSAGMAGANKAGGIDGGVQLRRVQMLAHNYAVILVEAIGSKKRH
jgi:hypothetical protein